MVESGDAKRRGSMGYQRGEPMENMIHCAKEPGRVCGIRLFMNVSGDWLMIEWWLNCDELVDL